MVAVVWERGGTVDQRCVGLHRFFPSVLFCWFAFKRFRRITRDVACLQISSRKRFSCTQTEFVDLLGVSCSPFSVPPIRNSICNGFVFWFCDYETVARSSRCWWVRWRALKQQRWPNQSESLRAPHCHFDSRKPAELYTGQLFYTALVVLWLMWLLLRRLKIRLMLMFDDDDGGDPPDRTLIFGAQLWWTVQ